MNVSSHPFTRSELATLLLAGLGLLALRLLYPQVYLQGGDFPNHVLASMQLHGAPLFDFSPLTENFFARLFAFRHGYTTLLVPWLLYELVFGLFGVTITETSLLVIHAGLGLLSLLSIWAFARLSFGPRPVLSAVLLVGVLPVHLSLSRVHVGTQILSLVFFYAGLTCLALYVRRGGRQLPWIYAFCLLAYIGCDNAFPLGLLFQLLYFTWLVREEPRPPWAEIRRLYLHPAVLLAVLLPVLAYLATTLLSLRLGVTSGYLLRTLGKGAALGFEPLKVLGWLLALVGPPAVLCAVELGLAGWRRRPTPSPSLKGGGKGPAPSSSLKGGEQEPAPSFSLKGGEQGPAPSSSLKGGVQGAAAVRLAAVMLGAYLLLFSLTSQVERSYVLLPAVPLAAGVVFRLPLGFSLSPSYGSVDYRRGDNDWGVKTLGYLVRSGTLPVSRNPAGEPELAVFLDYEGAQYYLGGAFHGWIARDLEAGLHTAYPLYLLAERLDSPGPASQVIQARSPVETWSRLVRSAARACR